MNRNQIGAHQQRYAFDGIQHREIGLRAVAAAVLYQGSNVDRISSCEPSTPAASATPSSDREPRGPERSAFPSRNG